MTLDPNFLFFDNFHIEQSIKLSSESSLTWSQFSRNVIYLRSWNSASNSHFRGTPRPLQHNRIGLRLLLYDLVHKSSSKYDLWGTVGHRDDVAFLTLYQDMMRLMKESRLLVLRMLFLPFEVVFGHQIGDDKIFLQLREGSDLVQKYLQMICWHWGQIGTKHEPSSRSFSFFWGSIPWWVIQ